MPYILSCQICFCQRIHDISYNYSNLHLAIPDRPQMMYLLVVIGLIFTKQRIGIECHANGSSIFGFPLIMWHRTELLHDRTELYKCKRWLRCTVLAKFRNNLTNILNIDFCVDLIIMRLSRAMHYSCLQLKLLSHIFSKVLLNQTFTFSLSAPCSLAFFCPCPLFLSSLFLFNYLTRAVYSPMSDPGKAVLPAWLPPASCFLTPASCRVTLSAVQMIWGSEDRVSDVSSCLWTPCEQSARPSMPIRIPSQIAVDWKSVHFSLMLDGFSMLRFVTNMLV